MRPSDIAAQRLVHPSLVTRQVAYLEDARYVEVTRSPHDRRSCLVALTPAGQREMARLQEVGLDRFARFVAEWEPEDVQMLAALLEKLTASMAAVARRERAVGGEGTPAPGGRGDGRDAGGPGSHERTPRRRP